MVVYHDHPDAIAARLKARDGESPLPEAIARHQDAELAHARFIASRLGITLVSLAAFDTEGLLQAIEQWR